MNFDKQMFGIFNIDTKELLSGPFKSENGARTSRSSVINSLIQNEYLYDNSLNYRIYTTYVLNPVYKKDPRKMIGMTDSMPIGRMHIPGNYLITQADVDYLLERIAYFNNLIQVKEVKVTF